MYKRQSPSNLQYNLNVNTEQATLQNMNVDEIYATIQAYMGSTFLNNFNIYGQEWQVYMQADAPYRNSIDKPVSYTHLDVYKRQLHGRAISTFRRS